MGFFSKFGDSYSQFMVNRNGMDKLAVFALIVGTILNIGSLFVDSTIVSLLGLAILLYFLFRIYSKNVAKREAENARFGELLEKIASPFRGKGKGGKSGKSAAKGGSAADKKRLTCPKCGQSLTVPKGKGVLKVKCPKCKNSFTAKS